MAVDTFDRLPPRGIRRAPNNGNYKILRERVRNGGMAGRGIPSLAAAGTLLCIASISHPADAQPVEEFYRGKTISVVIGYPTAGPPDIYGRLVTRHLGKYIPGNPSFITRNMPGAGSMLAANYMFNVAPADGTVLGLASPTLPLEETLGSAAAKFRSSQFNWIGRLATNPNVTSILNTSPVKTIQDAFEKVAILGATGRSSTNAIYPAVLNNVLGTKFKIVMGYEGTAAIYLAMERGEVDGISATLDGLKSQREEWLKTKKVNVVVQYLINRHPELPSVPTAAEVARTPEQATILRTVSGASEIGKYFVAPPNVSADRVAALRKAFGDMVKDPEFLAEAEKLQIEIDPMSGTELQKVVQEMQSVPAAVAAKIKAIYPVN
jgi:tripartite-type tricarboxylate transporter receptor subunit TctC